jgi:hypothetical protein
MSRNKPVMRNEDYSSSKSCGDHFGPKTREIRHMMAAIARYTRYDAPCRDIM